MNEIHVGFTGTQIGMTKEQKRTLNKIIKNIRKTFKDRTIWLHHGDCIGADHEANMIARSLRAQTISHPPKLSTKRAFSEVTAIRPPKDYLVRNHDIVDECSLLLAAPKGVKEELRSGTWATVRYAFKMSKACLILEPDGSNRVYAPK